MNESLHQLLSLPTAPYRESAVSQFIENELSVHGIPHFKDPVGNIIVGAESKKDYLSLLKDPKAEPLRIFIAHMDHPGFHGKKWIDSENLEVEWFGGSPYENCDGGTVKIHAQVHGKKGATPFEADGVFHSVELASHGRSIKTAVVRVTQKKSSAEQNLPAAESIFGYLSFRAPVWVDDGLIYSKCCDDLIGVHAILEAAKKTYPQKSKGKSKRSKSRPPFIGMITRAEETGFIGAIGHFELGWLKEGRRPRFVVSLETSKTLPQAEIGKGPILRLGDYMNVFDPALTYWLVQLANRILPGETQKRVMDGGRCEGSAALIYGLRTIALSVPLGNYHNQSLQGGPDARHPNGPAPEYVAEKDVERLEELVLAIVQEKVEFESIYSAARTVLKNSFKTAKTLLKQGQKE